MRNLLLSTLILASALQAALGEQDGDWAYSVSNGQATITRYTGAGGALTIPIVVNGIPVVKVGDGQGQWTFSGSVEITSLIIPSSVTSLGNWAFAGCTGLKNLIIADSVTSIGFGLVSGCSSLISITLPNSLTYIGGSMFNGLTSLTSINIPNSVTDIQFYAFAGCTSLASISIPNSVKSIGGYAFAGCTSLASITIPNSVTSIGDNAFANCSPSLVSSVISQLVANQANKFTAGQQSVMANPGAYNLYTTSQIQNMAVGDLVLNRQPNGGFVLNYEIDQSTDLQTWTPYQTLSLPLTGLPTDKAFVRIKAKQ